MPEPPAKAPRLSEPAPGRVAELDRDIAELEARLRERRAERARAAATSGAAAGFAAAAARATLPTTETLLMLQKWNTPTVYNGWEQITLNPNYGRECFNLEPVTDHMPQMGSMVGFAVTLRKGRSDPRLARELGGRKNREYNEFLASLPPHLPKVIVMEDEDKPLILGSMWGEVRATFSRSVGAVGIIVDGGVRDIDEMTAVGMHALSRGVCVGHAFGSVPVEWDVPVTVFGVTVRPGQLIHADKHGFLAVPEEDEARLLEATEYMDLIERKTVIVPGREGTGMSVPDIVARFNEASATMGKAKTVKYGSYADRFPGAAD